MQVPCSRINYGMKSEFFTGSTVGTENKDLSIFLIGELIASDDGSAQIPHGLSQIG